MRWMTRVWRIGCVALLAMPLSGLAVAAGPPGESGWQLRVGAGLLTAPAYPGADTYHLNAVPALRLSYGDRFFASVEEGVGYAVVATDDWQAGPLVRVAFGRDEDATGPFRIAGSRTNDLQGLGDVHTTAEPGFFVRRSWREFSLGAEVRKGINGHRGWVGDVTASYTLRFASPMAAGPAFLSMGPRVTFADGSYHRAFFGVDAIQSARSGLTPYSPGGGLLSYGIGGVMVVPAGDKVAITALAAFERLGRDAGRAPLVRDRGSVSQMIFGVIATYTFDFGN